MSLTLAEQAVLTRLATDRARRLAVARVLGSPLLRWRFGPSNGEDLLLVPQELRTADPSFSDEFEQGLFGLSGAVAHIGKGSVFDLPAPSEAWARELHGFGWLRNLRAARNAKTQAAAIEAVNAWITRFGHRSKAAWRPDVTGRRILSWLANANLLLRGVSAAEYDRIAESLGSQIQWLSASWGDAPPGYPRLVGLVALLTAGNCIAHREALIQRIEPHLLQELSRQILPDGGHISRNPHVVVELLLDLLPLKTCYAARHHTMAEPIDDAIRRMLRFARHMRLGDGSLGRFNGMGATPFDSLATLLSYDPAPEVVLEAADASRYARLAAGDAVALIDYGSPPPLEHAGTATASCLSFEFSVGTQPIFVNGGTPGPAEQDWLSASRATASHNTLVLGSRSSAKMLRSPMIERLVGGPPLRQPSRVDGQVSTAAEGIRFEGQHNGYVADYNLLHQRTLTLDTDGGRLSGEDRIASLRENGTRLPRDVPYSIHFHLHPNAMCRVADDPDLITIQLGNGELWYFRSEKATVSVEDSIHFADLVGPRRSRQIVLRGACFGDTSVRWSLSKLRHVRSV